MSPVSCLYELAPMPFNKSTRISRYLNSSLISTFLPILPAGGSPPTLPGYLFWRLEPQMGRIFEILKIFWRFFFRSSLFCFYYLSIEFLYLWILFRPSSGASFGRAAAFFTSR